MREELLPPAVDLALVTYVGDAYRELAHGISPVVAADHLSAAAGVSVSAEWLDGAFGSVDPDTAARSLSLPDDDVLAALAPTRAELIDIVDHLRPGSPTWDPDHEEWWMALLDAAVPVPDAASLIYHPPPDIPQSQWAGWGSADLVDYCRSRRPLAF